MPRLPLGHLPRRRRARSARIGFGDTWASRPGSEVPGEHRNALRRLIVTQGDTEPASRRAAAPARAHRALALRPAQPVPGERRGGPPPVGHGVPAPHATSGATAARRRRSCSQRRSGNPDQPRILGAFNEPIDDWLSFFMFTMFTDRDGKFQLLALAGVGLRPARAHLPLHADRGGAPHVRRPDRRRRASSQRTAELMREGPGRDVPSRRDPARHAPALHQLLVRGRRSTCSAPRSRPTPPASSAGASRAARRRRASPTTCARGHDAGRAARRGTPGGARRRATARDQSRGPARLCRGLPGGARQLEPSAGRPGRRVPLAVAALPPHVGIFATGWFDPDGAPIGEDAFRRRAGEWLPRVPTTPTSRA